MHRENWYLDLVGAIRASNEQTFGYGRRDCCIAVADLIEITNGIDLMDGLRGRYRSAAGASRLMKQNGYESLRAFVEARVLAAGGREINVAHGDTGDIVMTDIALHDQIRGEACGIALGGKFLFPGEVGWIPVRRHKLITAFRMG